MMKVIGIFDHHVVNTNIAPKDAVFFVCDEAGNPRPPAYSTKDGALAAVRALKNQEAADIEIQKEINAAKEKIAKFRPQLWAWHLESGESSKFVGSFSLNENVFHLTLSKEGRDFLGVDSEFVEFDITDESCDLGPSTVDPDPFN